MEVGGWKLEVGARWNGKFTILMRSDDCLNCGELSVAEWLVARESRLLDEYD